MKLPFRQGIVRYQTDVNGSPDFLRKSGDNYVTLSVALGSTIITFAQGDVDYLIEETQTVEDAWGPFPNTNHSYWLYWDINVDSGLRAFSYTISEPIIDFSAPRNPVNNQHWYDKTFNIMKVWSGNAWVEVIRVFAGTLKNGAILIQQPLGSQVGNNNVGYAGSILYDHNSKPIRSTQLNGRGKFLTTESPFYKQNQSVATIKFETSIEYVTTIEPIPAWSVVTYNADGLIGLASSALPYRPAVGLVQQDLNAGDVSIITTNGFITNAEWSWTQPANTPLFCGRQGNIVTAVPTSGIVHCIGYIVSHDTIFFEKSLPVHYYDPTQANATIPLELDLATGRLVTGSSNSTNSSTIGTLAATSGLKYVQSIDQKKWHIRHSANCADFLCQIFDEYGDLMLPDNITAVDSNNILITFNVNQTGIALITFII